MAGESPRAPLSPVKSALLELREMRAKLEAAERARTEPIAVVGLGCRFPGAANPDAFWELLCAGTDAIGEVPADRWNVDAYYDPDPAAPGKLSTRWGGFIESVDRFDPHFFGISPREAVSMDPQQRVLLEVTWEALERAGYSPVRLAGSRTGVFVGASTNDYAHLMTKGADLRDVDAYFATGNSDSVTSGRLSYLLGFQGPSLSVDTACSSSLVAVHLACQSLRAGECRMALAAGVNVILLPDLGVSLSKARMMAADGRCKTFDARADGFVRAEGCGVAVLKRLSDALADGDTVLAVVRGSAMNQDGRSSGLTAPNGPSQTSVIGDALASARVSPRAVGYVETHGTGTELGDPIEVQALAAALGVDRPADRPVMLGSVKTNIGHLESAAGIAGFIKTVLVLQHRAIPPHLHLVKPNPHIAWADLPVTVPTRLTPWRSDGPRIAGVSSFGFSGTNVHVVLEQAPDAPTQSTEAADRAQVLTVSAKDATALRGLAARWATHLAARPDIELADVCFTANVGRGPFEHRAACVVQSLSEARQNLTALSTDAKAAAIVTGRASAAPRVAFLFPGQGAQYAGMGQELFASEPVFRAALEECEAALETPGPALQAALKGRAGALDRTADAQPAMFAIEYALAMLWRAWRVEPAYVIGHSVGEFAAACVAGVLDVPTAIRLVAARGRLMQELTAGGEMAAVFAPLERVTAAVRARGASVSVAAENSLENIVIAGAPADVRAVLNDLAGEGIRARPLPGGFAFHSPLMEPVLDRLAQAAASAAVNRPRIGWVSTVTAELVTEPIGPEYWRRQARQAVRYATAARVLQSLGCDAFLEVGPGVTLTALANRDTAAPDLRVASLRPGRGERHQMLESAAALYARGADVDWRQVDGHARRRRVVLPTYPFQRERYWWPGAGGPTPPSTVPAPASQIVTSPPAPTAATSDGTEAQGRRRQVANAAPAERLELLVDYVRQRVAVVLRADPGRAPDRGQRLMDVGMDSLMAVELRGALGAGLALDRQLPATLMFDHPTIEAIARFLEREVLGAPGSAEAAPGTVTTAAADRDRVEDIAGMSDHDVEALLLKRLESL
jgi:acyl transferase domain-containing protein